MCRCALTYSARCSGLRGARRADHSASPPLFTPPMPSTQHAVRFVYARRLQRGSPRRRRRQPARRDARTRRRGNAPSQRRRRKREIFSFCRLKKKEKKKPLRAAAAAAAFMLRPHHVTTLSERSMNPQVCLHNKPLQRPISAFFPPLFFSVAESSWLALQTQIPPTFAIDEKDRISFFFNLGKIPPLPQSPHTHTHTF